MRGKILKRRRRYLFIKISVPVGKRSAWTYRDQNTVKEGDENGEVAITSINSQKSLLRFRKQLSSVIVSFVTDLKFCFL